MIKDDSGVPLSDWKALIEGGTFITGSNAATNQTQTLYTVPAGKAAYINTISFQHYSFSITVTQTDHFKLDDKIIIRHASVIVDAGSEAETINLNPAIPIKLTAGQTVKIESTGTAASVFGAFSGYEVNA